MADEVKEDTKEEKTSEVEQDPENIPTSGSLTVDEKSGLDEMLSYLKENTTLLHEIKEVIQGRLEYDAVKEKAIDKIDDELKFYRDGFVFQSQKSIFIDLMLLYDSLERILNSVTNEEVFSQEKLAEHLETFKEELLEILYRRDITPFDEHPEVLDYKLHKTVKTLPTDEENENNKVDRIIKIGFRWNDKILRPEEVIIKKYIKK